MFLRKKSRTDLVRERIQELTDNLSEMANELSGKAAVALAPKVETALDAASSAYGQASSKVRDDYASKVRDAALPAVAAARGKVGREKPKKHRLRNLIILLGLGGAAAYAAKKFGFGGQSPSSSFGQASPSGSYADTTSTSTPARPTAVPDRRDSTDQLSGDGAAAGPTFADADSELSGDLSGELSEEFTTTPPTEATPGESAPKPKGKSKPTS